MFHFYDYRRPLAMGFFLILFLASSLCAGGAWGRKKSTSAVHFNLQLLDSKKYYGKDGKVVSGPEYRKQVYQLSGEHGIIDDLSIGWVLPGLYQEYRDTRSFGAGDAALQLQYRFWKKWVPMAIGIWTEMPWGSLKRDSLPAGDGVWDFKSSFYAARVLWPSRLIFDGNISHILHTGGFTPRWQYNTSLLLKGPAGLKLRLSTRGQHLWEKADTTKFTSKFGYGEGVEYDAQSMEIILPSMGAATTVGFHTHLFGEAKNLPAHAIFSIGMGFEF